MKLQAKNIHFRYRPDHIVLQNISVQIRSGHVVALVGPNGSGKTTFIRILMGLLRPNKGTLKLDEKTLPDGDPGARARLIAFVPQHHHGSFPFSVLDVLLLGRNPYLRFFQAPGRKEHVLARNVLRQFQIEHLIHRPYNQLSGGELKLVMIARAFMQKPRIFLLDEPTAHLDFRNQTLILHRIREVARSQDAAVLITVHDPNLAAWHADEVLLMSGGKIVAQGEPGKVITRQLLKITYGMEVIVDRTVESGSPVILPGIPPEIRKDQQ